MIDSGSKLDGALRELAGEIARRERPPAALETVLRRSFRRHHARRRMITGIKIAALAACLTFAFAAATVAIRKLLATPPRVAEDRPLAKPADNRRMARPESPLQAIPIRKPPKRRSIQRPRPRPEESEVTTGFLTVGAGLTLGTPDRGSVVRVRLPRSALVAFGLPLNQNRPSDLVNADVLLGEDGMARAIRFVH